MSLRSVPGLYLLEMPVNLSQYRGSVGVFNNRNFFVQSKVSHFFHLSDINSNNNYRLAIGPLILLNKITLVLLLLNLMFLFKGNGSKHKKVIFIWASFSTFVSYNFLRWLYVLLITLSGDVELNPGPKRSTAQTLSICHWNLNSICAHNYAKLIFLRAYVSVRKFDIICLSETYLDYNTDDENLEISGYFLIRSDHPSNIKRGGICIYYKNILPLKVTDVRLLEECIAFDLIISNKLCSFVALYRSPSQSQDDFATFSDNLEMTLDFVSKKNPFLLVVLGDFNAKLSQWHDKDTSTPEGISVESITSQFGLHQIINEPTHILENSSSCIDLIFTSQPNLSVESGTQRSHHPNCHHQILYAIFNLEVIYPLPHTREVCHYQDVELIRRSLNGFDWDRAFANKHVDEKVEIFNKTVFNVLSNLIPHEVIVCNDKDPPWFNGKIKLFINEKLRTYNAYRKNIGNSQLRKNLSSLQQRLRDLIDDSKQKYFSRLTHKLSTNQKSSKAYWALLKIFLNNRKIPVIPPLFHNNKFATDFKEKAELFNSFFAKQCSLIKNYSKLPPRLRFLTDKRLSTIKFVDTDILKIIRNLNLNKAHGHDKISIRMLKICDNSYVGL